MNMNTKKKDTDKNSVPALLIFLMVALGIGVLLYDSYAMSQFETTFKKLEKERLAVSDKLATAMIVHENLNHVRDLIFNNMDFPGQQDTISHETRFFDFLTECLNDLKMKLVSFRPEQPTTEGRVTTYPYNIEIEGDFFRFGELNAKFENNRRLVSIESFDVDLISERELETRTTSTDFRTGNKGIKVRMRVNTYRIKKT